MLENADLSRILIYGVTGSGKSTLALALGEISDQSVTLADELTWLPNWVQVPDDEQCEKIHAVCQGESWILDTAYGKWMEIPLARATLVIGLDFPRWVSLWRLVKRTYMRARDKQPVCNGNVENWRLVFSRESILAWHFRSFKRKRARIRDWEHSPNRPKVIRLTNPRQVDALLIEIRGRYSRR